MVLAIDLDRRQHRHARKLGALVVNYLVEDIHPEGAGTQRHHRHRAAVGGANQHIILPCDLGRRQDVVIREKSGVPAGLHRNQLAGAVHFPELQAYDLPRRSNEKRSAPYPTSCNNSASASAPIIRRLKEAHISPLTSGQ